MGFLDRILGRAEIEDGLSTIHLNDLERWVQERRGKWDAEQAEPIIGEIIAQRDMAIQMVEDIRDYEFSDELKDRVFKPAVTAKPKYVKGLLEALSGIKNEGLNYEEVVKFHEDLLKTLKAIQKVQLSQGRYILAVYSEQVPKLGTHLNNIIDLTGELGGVIAEEKEQRGRLDSLSSAIEELKKKIASRAETSERKKELEKKILDLEGKVQEKTTRMNEFEKGKEYQDFIQTQEKVRKIQEQKGQIKGGVLNALGPLTRIFRKYKKLVEDGQISGDLRVIDGYIAQPVRAFFSEGEEFPSLRGMLTACERAFNAGVLPLDKKEREKMTTMDSFLSGAKSEFAELDKLEYSLKEKLSSSNLMGEIEKLASDIAIKKQETARLSCERDSIDKHMTGIDWEMPVLKKKIEGEILKIEGKKVSIEIS